MPRDSMSLSVMYPSAYLSGIDLDGKQWTVKIAHVSRSPVKMKGGKTERKVVITLENPKSGEPLDKEWLVCKTNGYALSLLLSPNPREASAKDWEGHLVTLCPDMDFNKATLQPCVRVAGSPDAAPDRVEAYKRAWDGGDRKRGELLARLYPEINGVGVAGADPGDGGEG